MKKDTGLLLHISSLPTDFGIGDFGPTAYQFADFLCDNGYKYWQILPLNRPGYGNSPYNPISSFVINPYLISPKLLYEDGLIEKADLDQTMIPISDQIPYSAVYQLKDPILAIAADNYMTDDEIREYIECNALYLKPYITYLMLCRLYDDDSWVNFQPQHKRYSEDLFEALFKEFEKPMLRAACIQAIAESQLSRLKHYVNSLGVLLIGDIPLYVSYNSSDVWSNRSLFQLDEAGYRLFVAGVPPDYFNSEGQMWGNPIYNWQAMQEQGFSFFLDRMSYAIKHLDKLRLDHFIGYVNYWSIPCAFDPATQIPVPPDSAKSGSWLRACPDALLSEMFKRFSNDKLIAEDLGILNKEICNYRDQYNLAGMIILQFCFDNEVPDVTGFPPNRFIYPGTHDNPTCRGWFSDLEPDSKTRSNIERFISETSDAFSHQFQGSNASELIHRILIEAAMNSGCNNVIIPVQDLLGLGNEGRMNIPGTALGNWQWRLTSLESVLEVHKAVFPKSL